MANIYLEASFGVLIDCMSGSMADVSSVDYRSISIIAVRSRATGRYDRGGDERVIVED
jgi:hypothetical protein